MPDLLYLEDLSVGQIFCSREYPVTTGEIIAFAGRYDPQPFHINPKAAEETFFHGLAASGWHTGAMTMRLMVETMHIAGGLIGAGVKDLRWPKPVRPGDTLTLQSEILAIRPSGSRPGWGVVQVRHTTLNQNNEPVQTGDVTMLVPSRNAKPLS